MAMLYQATAVPAVVGEQELVAFADDPAPEQRGFGVLDVGDVVGERLAEEDVALDGRALPQVRQQVQPRQVSGRLDARRGESLGPQAAAVTGAARPTIRR